MNIKNKIRSALAALGLGFKDLAEQMEISSSTLSIRLSSKGMTVANAIKMSDALNALTQTQLTLDDFRKDQS